MSGPKVFNLKYVHNSMYFFCDEINDIMQKILSFRDKITSGIFEKLKFDSGDLNNFDNLFKRANEINSKAQKIKKITIHKSNYEAENLLSELKKISVEIFSVKKRILKEIIKIRDSIFRKAKALENTRLQIASVHLACNFQVSKDKITNVQEKIKKIADINIPKCPPIEYNDFNYENIIKFQNMLEKIESEIKKKYIIADKYIKSLNNECQNEFLNVVEIVKYKSIDDLINEKQNKLEPSHKELQLLAKANIIISKLSEFIDNHKFKEVLIKFDQIKDEENFEGRTLLYNNFVIFCDKMLKQEKHNAKIIEEFCEIKKRLKLYKTHKSIELITKIEKLMETKDFSSLDKIKAEALLTIGSETMLFDNKRMSKIIKSAFDELGYETEENFDTILVKNQKMLINKLAMKNYKVQVLSNSDNSMLQLEVVRIVSNDRELNESTKSHEVRDIEIETEFCKDYDNILNKLEESGILVTQKMRKKPGEIKVKKILASEIRGNAEYRAQINYKEKKE